MGLDQVQDQEGYHETTTPPHEPPRLSPPVQPGSPNAPDQPALPHDAGRLPALKSASTQCVRPLVLNRARGGREVGAGRGDQSAPPVTVSCGACIACRLRRSGDWMLRAVHEAQFHEHNSFITLTYSPQCLPADGSLDVSHLQRFWRRCRKRGLTVRYLACGEYGSPEKGQRPHYHACVFGEGFYPHIGLPNGQATSPILASLWKKGHVTVSPFTAARAAYVAKYTLKKKTGALAKRPHPVTGLAEYERVDALTGEVYEVRPEFAVMSRKPGIGAEWIKAFRNDVYPHDYVVHDGGKFRPPVFYDRSLPPHELEEIKAKRVEAAREATNHPQRREAREKILSGRERLLAPRDKL